MITWKLTLEYDGTDYAGWQEQANARTVLDEVRKAAGRLFGEVSVHGAGRTDAGVHASGQVAHLRVPGKSTPKPEAIRDELNALLPPDIVVVDVERSAGQFHARHSAARRSYVYQIATRKSAFSARYAWWVREPLDLPAMRAAAAKLVGRHDFVCFCARDAKRPEQSTVVHVESAAVEQQDDLLVFRIVASHFLWRMVRRIAGALVKVGTGEIRSGDFEKLLAGKSDPKLDVASWTAPARGLFLESVAYQQESRRR